MGHSALYNRLIGSTTDRLVEHAACMCSWSSEMMPTTRTKKPELSEEELRVLQGALGVDEPVRDALDHNRSW